MLRWFDTGRRLAGVTAVVAAGLIAVLAGAALAVSIGPYSSAKMGCPKTADANTYRGSYRGCHNVNLTVQDGNGRTYLEAGTLQENQQQNVHSGTVAVSPNGTATPRGTFAGPGVGASFDTHYQPIPPGQCGLEDIALYGVEYGLYLAGQSNKPCPLDPTKWRLPNRAPTVTPTIRFGRPNGNALGLLTEFSIFVGGDDNLDTGEHDGVNGQYGSKGAANGPSDGGSVTANWHPLQVVTWLAELIAVTRTHSLAPIAENPFPLLDAGGGACADGICLSVQTRQRSMYQGGGGAGKSRDVYDYQGKTWSPVDCSSGDPRSEKACRTEGHHTMTWYRQHEAKNVYAEPGVQFFEDPDPQASAILPMYPLPAIYVGSCGVVIGGGSLQAPKSPFTNTAGQLVIDPAGC